MKVHFIAIGGSAMHNLALALHQKGDSITGSDDEIFEPSRSRLKNRGLLPDEYGWFPEKITEDLDAVILGMHARIDNPELQKAKEIGVKIFSYPEFLYEQSKDKRRVVIAGSHGKTSITAMVMHVLQIAGMDFDFMVGAQLDGFDVMVRITEQADLMIFEGDEYLTSAIDPRPKFHLYKPHIALITGIAWDHINVFPTFKMYVEQFETFIGLIAPGGTLIYYEGDKVLEEIIPANVSITAIPYGIADYVKDSGQVSIVVDEQKYPLHIFGDHNLQNIAGAMKICESLGIPEKLFAEAISSFKGAAKRLQLIDKSKDTAVYLDFAHAPSKLKATVSAVKDHFPDRELIACMELHTFSSLSEGFLSQYKGAMDKADQANVYFSPHTLELKKLPAISIQQVKDAFDHHNMKVYTDSSLMLKYLLDHDWSKKNLLLMSSGSFDGLDFSNLAHRVISKEKNQSSEGIDLLEK